jgi:hypothetical protein
MTFTLDEMTALLILAFITGLAGLLVLWLIIRTCRNFWRYRRFYRQHARRVR